MNILNTVKLVVDMVTNSRDFIIKELIVMHVPSLVSLERDVIEYGAKI